VIIKNQDLIEEFYLQERDKYPGVSLEEFKDIITSPWQYVKQEMETSELPTIRLKYFGTFQVYEGRARNMLHNFKRRMKFHRIGREEFETKKTMLENYLKKT
jgi:nucleoid DNA-binding protein|tara:strand:- start:14438 stop:14743 length:306 start_codon:yes stop_codon:yes gene_type:complete